MLSSIKRRKIKGTKMKFFYKLFLAVLLLVNIFGCSDTGSNLEDLKQFGTTKFSKETWNSGDSEKRATVIYDYIKNVNHELSISKLKEDLGESDAYYMYDSFPAYYLGKQNSHTLAFITDESTGRITNIELISN